MEDDNMMLFCKDCKRPNEDCPGYVIGLSDNEQPCRNLKTGGE